MALDLLRDMQSERTFPGAVTEKKRREKVGVNVSVAADADLTGSRLAAALPVAGQHGDTPPPEGRKPLIIRHFSSSPWVSQKVTRPARL